MADFHEQMFIPEATLEAWIEASAVEVDGREVRLPARRLAYDIAPAVRVLRIVAGADRSNAVGKVLSEDDIGAHGGELMGDSLVFGEVAFEVAPGFLASARTWGR